MSLLSTVGNFLGTNKVVIAILLIGVGIIATQGLMLYVGNQRLETVQESVGALRKTVDDQKAVIETLQTRFADANRATEAMSQRAQAIQEETARMAKLLATAKLGQTAAKQPAKVQTTVNKTTLEVLRDLEAVTDPNRILGKPAATPGKE